MAVITNNLEWHDNMYIRKFVKETRVGGEVQSLTIKLKAYKLDAIGTLAGDGNMLSYNDQSATTKTVNGKNYKDFDGATALLEKSFTWSVPNAQRTSVTQSSNQSEYRTKRRTWRELYKATYILDETDSDNILMEDDTLVAYESSDYEDCYNAFWTDLEALDVYW